MVVRLAVAAHNTEKCFEAGVFGLTSGSGKVLQRFLELKSSDILVFYKAKSGFAGIWKIVSDPYNDKTKIWDDGEYPKRVKIEPIVALKPEQYISAKTMVDELEMVTHPLYYGIAFRENLKEISEKDYKLIKKKLEEAAKK